MNPLERDRAVAALLLAGLATLLVFVALHLGGKLPELPAPKSRPTIPRTPVPVAAVSNLLQAPPPVHWHPTNTTLSPFHTTFYIPPPAQPPTTRKVELTYQGSFASADGLRRAFVKVGDALLVGTNGTKVVADHAIAAIELRSVLLTNAAGATNLLLFNVKKEVEVPAK